MSIRFRRGDTEVGCLLFLCGGTPRKGMLSGLRLRRGLASRACLKKAFCKMCVTICGRFLPDEGAVAGYGNRIRVKYTAKWGVQIAGMIFQTHSSVKDIYNHDNIIFSCCFFMTLLFLCSQQQLLFTPFSVTHFAMHFHKRQS